MKNMLSEEELERYQRSIIELGVVNQEKLKEKTVLQVGAGGLGSPLSLYLTAAGIGHLIIFEDDHLDLSNLGRQILYKTDEIGKSKVDLAKQKLQSLNPNVKITIKNYRLTIDNFKEFMDSVGDIDYLVDASDNFNTKFLINDIGMKYDIPFTIAGIQGYFGQIISVIPRKTTCYRCIFGMKLEQKKTDQINAEKAPIPVIAPICGVVGSIQAMEIIKGLLSLGNMITDGMLMVNLKDMDFQRVPIKQNPKCSCMTNFD